MASFLKLGSIYHAIYGWAHLSGVVAAASGVGRRSCTDAAQSCIWSSLPPADLLFRGMMPACGSANIPDCLFSASGMRLLACLFVAPQRGYDEPAILSYAISSFCPTSAAASEQIQTILSMLT